jgi:hypothetical protein
MRVHPRDEDREHDERLLLRLPANAVSAQICVAKQSVWCEILDQRTSREAKTRLQIDRQLAPSLTSLSVYLGERLDARTHEQGQNSIVRAGFQLHDSGRS